jgi:ribonuclease HI
MQMIQLTTKNGSKLITPSINKYFSLYFDGCSKGNPGPAGAGAVLYYDKNEIWSDSIFVGERETNNTAEYNGLILGLNKAIQLNIKKLLVFGDSELVIKQINGVYKVKSETLKPLYNSAIEKRKLFDDITFIHVYRNDNKRADELSNLGLQKKLNNTFSHLGLPKMNDYNM